MIKRTMRGARNGMALCTAVFFAAAASFCLVRIPLYSLLGPEGTAYIIPGMELFALFYAAFVSTGALTARRMVRTRRLRGRFSSIPRVLKTVRFPTLIAGLVLTLLCLAGCRVLAAAAGANFDLYLLFVALSPAFLFLSLTGILRGYEEAMLSFRVSVICTIAEAALRIALMLLFGKLCFDYGTKAAALLRNPSVAPLYGAAGAAAGLSAASLLTLLLWLFCHRITGQLIRGYLAEHEDTRTEQESDRSIRRAYWSSFLLTSAALLFLAAPVLADYRLSFYFAQISDPETGALWASYYSKTLSIVFAAVFILLIPFVTYPAKLGGQMTDQNLREFRRGFGMVMRLLSYVLMPVSFFFIAAARILTAVGYGIDDSAAEVTLEWSGPAVLFFGTALFLVMLCLSTHDIRCILIAVIPSFVLQTGLFILLARAGISPELAGAVSFLVFSVLLCLLLMVQLRSGTLRRNRWAREAVLAAICAVLAAIPVFLAGDYLYEHIGAAPALLVLAAVYLAAYVLLTIFLRVCDLRELHRIPGGDIIVMLFYLFGR